MNKITHLVDELHGITACGRSSLFKEKANFPYQTCRQCRTQYVKAFNNAAPTPTMLRASAKYGRIPLESADNSHYASVRGKE